MSAWCLSHAVVQELGKLKHCRGVHCISDPATSHMDVRSACMKKNARGRCGNPSEAAACSSSSSSSLSSPSCTALVSLWVCRACKSLAEPNVAPHLAALVPACPGQGTVQQQIKSSVSQRCRFRCDSHSSTPQALAASERRFSDSARALSVVRPQDSRRLLLSCRVFSLNRWRRETRPSRPRVSQSKLRTNVTQLIGVEDSRTSFPAVHCTCCAQVTMHNLKHGAPQTSSHSVCAGLEFGHIHLWTSILKRANRVYDFKTPLQYTEGLGRWLSGFEPANWNSRKKLRSTRTTNISSTIATASCEAESGLVVSAATTADSTTTCGTNASQHSVRNTTRSLPYHFKSRGALDRVSWAPFSNFPLRKAFSGLQEQGSRGCRNTDCRDCKGTAGCQSLRAVEVQGTADCRGVQPAGATRT